jgi:hypothetical protein
MGVWSLTVAALAVGGAAGDAVADPPAKQADPPSEAALDEAIELLRKGRPGGFGAEPGKRRGSAPVIRGVVRFAGTPPAPRPAAAVTDPVCARTAPVDESVVVTDGKLRDVLVRVRPRGKGHIPGGLGGRPAPVVIDQTGCMYRPRVVAVRPGQPLSVRNADGTMHNVHAFREGETEFNLAQPKGAPPIERKLEPSSAGQAAAQPDVVELRCDVHPWMRAYAVLVDGPGFAVTGADGTFEIGPLLPGKYRVEAWHATLGTRSMDVVVRGKKTAVEVALTFGGTPATSK